MEGQSNRKRTNSGSANDQNNQARKKAKIRHARVIHTQNVNPQHSKLPKFLDVEKFISSRSFEIGAMERSMKLARDASGKRSFQTLPRHLRRRAASHFVRRVPTKLRPKARFEMKNDKPKILSKSVKSKLSLKEHKNRDRTKTLLKRQVEKKWLKTHIWHAKRTKMTDLWGFRLAKTPTEKCFRTTYRAARHGFTLHDLSYYTHLNLSGEEEIIKQTLKTICDPTGVDPCSLRFTPGHRAAEIHLYSHQGWPYSLIGPATLLWRPVADSTLSPKGPLLTPSLDEANNQTSDRSPSSGSSTQRTVLLQIHPSLKTSTTEAIALASGGKVAVEELAELGCLELGGPRCLEMMGRVLTGIQEAEKREVESWLDAGFKPSVIPMGMIVGLTVDDPRLKFPPKKKEKSDNLCPLQAQVIQPVIRLAKCDRFWDRSQSQKGIKFKKSDLDQRRANLDVPGSGLDMTEEDDQISMLLVRIDGGWRMILPNNWTKAFFHSFIFSSARLVCLDQRAQIDFEAGHPSFPRDYPTLLPAAELADQHGSEEARYWARKPPAKRVNFKLMESRGGEGGDPFVPDWDVVIGQKGIQRNKRGEVMEELITDEIGQSDSRQPWLLIGPLVRVIVNNVQKLADSTREKQTLETVCGLAFQLIDRIIKKLKADLQWDQTNDLCKAKQLDSGLVRVKMLPTGNDGRAGVLKPLARLYWNRNTHENPPKSRKRNDQTEFIGLITTGSFRLSNGSSIGFGAISLRKLIPIIICQQWMIESTSATVIDQGKCRNRQSREHSDGQGVTENKRIQKKTSSFQISYRNTNQFELEPARIELAH
ncbi:hypothetical protein PTTG_05957 [Puccinia triticina 1-1 BBBD Race 1]|uniref:Uncharacterized protein n=2 Tax=Puccinia triticina TaxID=208348 RepID=A0A180H6E6_PUCT1|nr:uncharacterized protein PtA15_9A146 [Puccinia triticina]OAW00120.1 hypothetical protein PTTG_05957 [Puccinia triticina 1-1 BBBD Race 1]WAQ88021.1 hypothetical protein PtA15_9A146 [Puccinia triticina]WAR60218.1 hypothetical protein PtB15_9B155 [Puccinia triticina]